MEITDAHLLKLVGSALGGLAAVRLFLGLAGVSFSTRRQIVVAYIVLAIAAVFISAAGDADGGAPNYKMAQIHVIGASIACAIEIILLHLLVRRSTHAGR